jgi:membrane protein DedA with SNARE-associated domain
MPPVECAAPRCWVCCAASPSSPDSCVRQTENAFLRYGVGFLLFAKFVPGLGTLGPPLAGAAGVGVLRFSFYSASGASLWISAWMALGYGA